MNLTDVVTYGMSSVLLLSVLLIVLFVFGNKMGLYKLKKDIYISTGTVDTLIPSEDYTRLYSFMPKDYGINVDQYSGFFEVTLEGVTTTSNITFVVRDSSGNDLGEEILITKEKPYRIPFLVEQKTNFISLFYKTTSTEIIQKRIEIYIN
jgi:hypothetical protein